MSRGEETALIQVRANGAFSGVLALGVVRSGQTLVYTAGRANSYKKSVCVGGVSGSPRGFSKSDSLKDSGKCYGYVRRITLRWVVGQGVR